MDDIDNLQRIYWGIMATLNLGFEEASDAYLAEHIFFVPPMVSWSFIKDNAKTICISTIIDDTMIIENLCIKIL